MPRFFISSSMDFATTVEVAIAVPQATRIRFGCAIPYLLIDMDNKNSPVYENAS
jgi:hypothetical protein